MSDADEFNSVKARNLRHEIGGSQRSVSDTDEAPREWKGKVYKTEFGYDIVYDGATCRFEPGKFHMIEHSAYVRIKEELDALTARVAELEALLKSATLSNSATDLASD